MIFKDDILKGKEVITKETSLQSIADYFQTTPIHNYIVYKVDAYIPSDTEGSLSFGISHISSGDVNGEFYMTKGHFHQNATRAEYYWGIKGNGILLLMDRERQCQIIEVTEGSLHYIPGHLAHRLINIGDDVLSVGACWCSDSGYDYETIKNEGFSVRIFKDTQQKYTIVNTSKKEQ